MDAILQPLVAPPAPPAPRAPPTAAAEPPGPPAAPPAGPPAAPPQENSPLDSAALAEGMVAQDWLARSASQLTYFGLERLHSHVTDGQLLVFSRNNHFSTLTKHSGEIYLLATDFGYLHEAEVVWERLNQVCNEM